MSTRIRNIIIISLASVLLIFALVYYNFIYDDGDLPTYKVGEKVEVLTEFNLYETSVKDDKVVLKNCFDDGKAVVINFWYPDCDPCVEELPHFEKVSKEYADKAVVIALNGPTFTSDGVQEFIASTDDSRAKVDWSNYTMMIGQDTKEINFYKRLGGKGAYPMTAIIDQNGFITCIRVGKMSEAELKTELDKAINN